VLEIFPVYISAFEHERLIRVYLPKNYNKENQSYPVLYMHDGQNVFRDDVAIGGTSLGLKKYLDENELDVIVVGIDQNSKERLNEYCPWVNGEYSKKIVGPDRIAFGGKGSQYVEFLVNELKPLIDNKYRTLQDRSAIAGISLGGLISAYAMCRYPHIFKNMVGLSSAFFRNQEEIEKLLQDAETDLSLIESVYLDCGTREAKDEDEINKEFIASNRAVYEILKKKIPHARFEIIHEAEHNYSFFKERVPELFTFLRSFK
jgi:predicted alpha/beta superfamily hydrolase